jgi:polysaccharide export outer membrane protein
MSCLNSTSVLLSVTFRGYALIIRIQVTLLDLIIIGQIGWYADGNRASIIRNVNGKPQRFGVRMDDLVEDADMSLNVKIMPGDILVIPEAFF